MKKVFAIFILVIVSVSFCNAQDYSYSDKNSEQNEIHLDVNVQQKEYNLKKPDLKNEPVKETDDDDMPFNLMTSPLQLLRMQDQLREH